MTGCDVLQYAIAHVLMRARKIDCGLKERNRRSRLMLCGNLKSVGSLESRRGNQNRQARRLLRNRTCVFFLNYGIGKWEPPATGERRVSTGISRV